MVGCFIAKLFVLISVNGSTIYVLRDSIQVTNVEVLHSVQEVNAKPNKLSRYQQFLSLPASTQLLDTDH